MAKVNKPKFLQIIHLNGSESNSLSSGDDDTSQISDCSPLQSLFSYKYISCNDLIRLLNSNNGETIIIDIRNCRHFQISHVQNAINFSCSSSLMCRRSIVKWSKSKNSNPNFDTIILYDDSDIQEQFNALAFKFIDTLRRYCDNVNILRGGFNQFQQVANSSLLESSISSDTLSLYCVSPTHKHSSSADVHLATLSEIIPDFLYLGNEMDAKDKASLKGHKITDIINVTSTVPHYFEKRFKYHRLPASDSDKQDIAQYFDKAYEIINDVKNSGGRVFIHCWAGVSRSVTIAMMYLIKSRHLDVLDALEFVKKSRNIADPNLNFLGQLSQIKV